MILTIIQFSPKILVFYAHPFYHSNINQYYTTDKYSPKLNPINYRLLPTLLMQVIMFRRSHRVG